MEQEEEEEKMEDEIEMVAVEEAPPLTWGETRRRRAHAARAQYLACGRLGFASCGSGALPEAA